ncbi:uncharacterized protein LOC131243375 [Magnolia sinica]|uniref:uncharacterized protein LOC131243375 n=1 Tax=Magnolia sinica TaxID=86752 RepID=UPI00265A9022|nr:uncharacterized protein LOC131243375 [Magnolia sinica]
MGALAPFPPWIPEDDLLLKNAVEAGASLESLAKGAVCFSRRFSIRELQDRWHSLLYDSDISAEASAHIVEIELSVSNLPRPNRSCNFKGKEWMPGKRKVDSVRSHYHAMRKRICHEPCNSVGLDFLVPPAMHICTGNEGGYQEQLKLNTEHAVGNCMPGGDDFGFPDADWAITDHDFRQITRADAVGSLEDDGIMTSDCLYGFAENVSSVSVDEAGGNGTGRSFEHNNLHEDIPQILGDNLDVFQNCPRVQEMGQPQTLPASNLFGSADDEETKSLSTLDPINNNQGNACSGCGGNQNFSSPVSDCSASFNQLVYSSPLPTLHMWRTIEDIPAPTMPIEANLEHKDNRIRDPLALPSGDVKKLSSPQYDVVHHLEPKLSDGLSSDGLNHSAAITDGDLITMSNSLLNFENEELLFMDVDVDEKDMIDRSSLDGLNSILLSSPTDGHQDDIPNSSEPQASAGLDTCLVITKRAYNTELDDIDGPLHSDHSHRQNVCDSEFSVSAASSQNPHSSELLEGFMVCTLNTEDPEIPCNDDVFSPAEVQGKSEGTTRSFSSAKDFCDTQKASEQVPAPIKEERETPVQSTVASLMLSKLGSKHPGGGHPVKAEFPENDSLAVASRHAGIVGEDAETCTNVHATPHCVPIVTLKQDVTTIEMRRHENNPDSFLEKSVQGSDHTKSYPQNTFGGCKLEVDVPMGIQKHASSHAELGPGEMGLSEPATNFSTSDHEEILSESDNDVPYFSDIEAMILDMDLGPYDEESNFTREVSRYQYEDTKKAIIRLEQGAHSYMQRAIASHGAFAVFYGRYLRHYIKKSEVTLGRATEDVNVDIDLGREGRANKISRRQAIIKMEEDGSFYLKNLGKGLILVNSKEVATGHRFSLSSSCLIEIRGMRFMFEMKRNFGTQNKTASVAKLKSSQEKNTKFDWLPR